tara:strand:- start:178 stop:822 length:645 start_codon:yes stop_codon:yes gene_type:complete
MNKTKERYGFLIFFISMLIVTQLRWCDKFDYYKDIELRLSVAILFGALLYWVLGKFFDIFEERIANQKWQRVITDVSYTFSFSFLFVAFYQNNENLGVVIIFLSLIYLVKSNDKALKWLASFKNSNNFEVELDDTKEMPVLNIKGKHDPTDLVSFQYLCLDLSENFFKMKDKKFKEVQLDLKITNNSTEQIMPLIQAIANIHAVTLKSENITTA